MGSINAWILSIKVLLISAGALTLAMGIKFSVPIAVKQVPIMWSIIVSWLKPPYLYVVINGIIITIAASSRFHQTQPEPPAVRFDHQHLAVSVRALPPPEFAPVSAHPEVISTVVEEPEEEEESAAVVVVYESGDRIVELKPVVVNGSEVYIGREEETLRTDISAEAEGEDDVLVDSTFAYNTQPPEIISPESELEYLVPVTEKPLASARLPRRKAIRSNRKGVRARRQETQQTLESTWKMIMEGRQRQCSAPLTKKSTEANWGQHNRHLIAVRDHAPESEIFKDRTSCDHDSSSAAIQKEASLDEDELNRRVEAFIKKFNEEMRLQRKESLDKYMEMINNCGV